MGSEEILDLRYREAFSFIGISQRKEAEDKRTLSIAAKLTRVFKINTSTSQPGDKSKEEAQYSGGSIEPISQRYYQSLNAQRSNLLYTEGIAKSGL